MRSGRSMPRPGMPSRASSRSTTGAGSAVLSWFHSREGTPEGKRPPLEGASRSRGESARRPGLRRRPRGGVVPIRLAGGASAHLSPKGMGGRSHGGTACLSHHVHLRRQGLSAERRRSCGGWRCPRSDREGGRRGGRGLSARPTGREDPVPVSLHATRSLFEEVGFSYERPKGKKNCVMRRTVSPVAASRRARVG